MQLSRCLSVVVFCVATVCFVIIFCLVTKVLLCSYQGVLSVVVFCVATVCFVRMFWLVVKVLLCSYQGVLSVVVFCVATVCFCYNVLAGCQGVRSGFATVCVSCISRLLF